MEKKKESKKTRYIGFQKRNEKVSAKALGL